jgi:alpha-L-fucosidase
MNLSKFKQTHFNLKQTALILSFGIFINGCYVTAQSKSDNKIIHNKVVSVADNLPELPPILPIPTLPALDSVGSVPVGDPKDFPEVKMNFPIAVGPFEPTWNSISENYPTYPGWLREAKFGIWVHFGPQASGMSGDWYARRMYLEGQPAYNNHIRDFGHPSVAGYKDILRDWNPTKLDPVWYVKLYHDAGARFLFIQGVHHDNFDLWDSKYQSWNSVNMGPKRDLLGEWAKAVRQANMHYGVTFHHEYTWWWWESVFRSDEKGDKASIPYDGNLTLADGKGKWWEGYDPRLLYGINLREYKGVDQFQWTPPQGIFTRHLDYAHWYATNWALRIMDVIEKYDPDFIYTDGNDTQPFSGYKTGTGYKCDAAQRVIASYYNRSLKKHGQIDVFSIIKFHPAGRNGVVTTFEGNFPKDIKTDQAWIGENAVGDWYYALNFTYSSAAVIRFLLECVSRDGCYAVNIPMMPDGSLEPACVEMLQEIGDWLKMNGEGIYGSKAWVKLGEGKDDKLRTLPTGQLGKKQADFAFSKEDFRFTVGKDGNLYAFCMTIPAPGTQLAIISLGRNNKDFNKQIASVKLLGCADSLTWSQDIDALRIICPASMSYKTSICFKINLK